MVPTPHQDPPYLLLSSGKGDRWKLLPHDSTLLTNGVPLVTIPGLRPMTVVDGTLHPIPNQELGVEEAEYGATANGDDTAPVIALLPLGAAAYLDTRATARLVGASPPPGPATLLFGEIPVADVEIRRPPIHPRANEAVGDGPTVFEIIASTPLPWYPGLPYALTTSPPSAGPAALVVETTPKTPRKWSGRVGREQLRPGDATFGDSPVRTASGTVDFLGLSVPHKVYDGLATRAVKAARVEGGVPYNAIARSLKGIWNPIRRLLPAVFANDGLLGSHDGLLFPLPATGALSPIGRGVLKDLQEAGDRGIDLSGRQGAYRETAGRLEQMALAVVVRGRLALSTAAFSKLASDLRRTAPGVLTADTVVARLGCSKGVAKEFLRRLADEGHVVSTAAAEAQWLSAHHRKEER